MIVDAACTADDVNLFAPFFATEDGGPLPSHKRSGMQGTLHRLSFTTHPAKRDAVIAVTARVGRAMEGVIDRMAPFLRARDAPSLLLVGCARFACLELCAYPY